MNVSLFYISQFGVGIPVAILIIRVTKNGYVWVKHSSFGNPMYLSNCSNIGLSFTAIPHNPHPTVWITVYPLFATVDQLFGMVDIDHMERL